MDFEQSADKVNTQGEEGADHYPLWDYTVGKVGKIKKWNKKDVETENKGKWDATYFMRKWHWSLDFKVKNQRENILADDKQ